MDGDTADYRGTDIISSLPNEILCHILSFLPTKYAVGTCILSTRWKNLFPLTPQLRLHLDDTFLLHRESASETTAISFLNFSRRLLNVTLHDVTSIYSLGLVCVFFNDGLEVANWVRAALRLKVKKLTLCTHQLHNPSFLFDSLYGNIVSLSLFLDFADSIPECRFSLPNLNKLFVHHMKYNVVNALIASCPSLECLLVQNCFCFPGEKLQICSSSLKGLKLVNCVYSLEGEIEIDAPKLEFLGHGGFFASRYLIQRLTSLQAARFDLDQNTVLNPFLLGALAMELVKACYGAERLWFSPSFIWILLYCPHPLPSLPKLELLMLAYLGYHGWQLLPTFLNRPPNLNMLFMESFDVECFQSFSDSLEELFSLRYSYHNERGLFYEIRRKEQK